MDSTSTDQFYTTIGLKIAEARREAGLKQEDLAKEINLSRTSLVNIEKGRQKPAPHIMYEIALRIGVSLDSLFPDTTHTFSENFKASWIEVLYKTRKPDQKVEENSKVIDFLNNRM